MPMRIGSSPVSQVSTRSNVTSWKKVEFTQENLQTWGTFSKNPDEGQRQIENTRMWNAWGADGLHRPAPNTWRVGSLPQPPAGKEVVGFLTKDITVEGSNAFTDKPIYMRPHRGGYDGKGVIVEPTLLMPTYHNGTMTAQLVNIRLPEGVIQVNIPEVPSEGDPAAVFAKAIEDALPSGYSIERLHVEGQFSRRMTNDGRPLGQSAREGVNFKAIRILRDAGETKPAATSTPASNGWFGAL